jgi:hypothetical protein
MGRNFGGRAALLASVLVSGLMVGGCMSSPTYGTGRTANAQLTSDLSSMFSMRTQRGAAPDHRPRPELVKPATTAELPPPQDSVTSANPAWPESPERKRARILAEISDDQASNNAEPLVVNDMAVAGVDRKRSYESPDAKQDREAAPMSNRESQALRAQYNKRLAESNVSPTSRKYLSEPPLEYRVPAETAPVGDVGEDEAKKARRLKKQARKGGGWRDLVPWL